MASDDAKRKAVDSTAKKIKDSTGCSSEQAHKEAVKIADRVSRHKRDGRNR